MEDLIRELGYKLEDNKEEYDKDLDNLKSRLSDREDEA